MVEEMVVEKGGVGGWCWPAKGGLLGCVCCCFWWPLLAANEGGEEKMKEREDGSGYLYKGKVYYYNLALHSNQKKRKNGDLRLHAIEARVWAIRAGRGDCCCVQKGKYKVAFTGKTKRHG